MLPLVADAACHVDGTVAGGGSAWFYDADPDDGTIQYAESMGFTTWNGAGIIGRTMRFSMDGIRTLEGEDSRTIATGDWDLKFEMNYVATTVDLPAGQETTWQGAGVTIDAVAVSSVGVTVDYTIDRQIGDLGPSGRLSDEARAKQDAVLGLPVTVAFADGTTFDATNANTTAVKQDDGTSAVTKTVTYDRIVAASDIVSVTVGDVEIPVSAASPRREPSPPTIGARRPLPWAAGASAVGFPEDHNAPCVKPKVRRRRPRERDGGLTTGRGMRPRRPTSPRRDGPAPHWR